MARFEETVNIQPQTIATGQSQVFQSLGERLDQFSQQTAQIAEQKVIEGAAQRGSQEGLESQQQGEPLELKEETFIGGISRRAYNQAARESYLKSLDNDNIEAITNIATENFDNLQGFNDAVEAYSQGVMQNVDPASKSAVALSLDTLISRARPKIQAAQAQRVVDDANEQQSINADERGRIAQSAAFEGDAEMGLLNLAAAHDSIDNRTDLSESQKVAAKRDLDREVREAGISGELAREFDANGPQAAMDMLDDMKAPAGFTPDEWDSYVRTEQTKITRKVARQKQITKEEAEAAKLAARVERGKLFLDPAVPADPAKSSVDREDVNLYYNDVSPSWTQLPIQEQVDINVDFVKNTGIVPDQMISSMNASMRSGTPEQVALMSDVIGRIQEVAPATLKDIPQESRAIALQVSDAQKAGIGTELALEQARKYAFGLTSQEKETIKLQTQEVSKDLNGSLQSFLDSDVDEGGFDRGLFYSVPDATPAMLGEYRNSFSRFMNMTGGNADQAQRLAFQAIKSTWGVTETGGPKRFMKYSPEVIYNVPNFGANWIEDQFNEEMEALGRPDAIIAIDHSVARDARPSYPVLAANDAGVLEPVFDEAGNALRYQPDFKETEEYSELMGRPVDAIRSAKKQRAVNMERRANQIRRGIQSRVLSSTFVPVNERADFMASDEGRRRVSTAINNMQALGKIDDIEAAEARKAFGVE